MYFYIRLLLTQCETMRLSAKLQTLSNHNLHQNQVVILYTCLGNGVYTDAIKCYILILLNKI
jgi:hypothetical protein